MPKNKYQFPNLKSYYDAPQGFISINRDGQINATYKPKDINSPPNKDKRLWINILNNYFANNPVPDDLQFDGDNFTECYALMIPLKTMIGLITSPRLILVINKLDYKKLTRIPKLDFLKEKLSNNTTSKSSSH